MEGYARENSAGMSSVHFLAPTQGQAMNAPAKKRMPAYAKALLDRRRAGDHPLTVNVVLNLRGAGLSCASQARRMSCDEARREPEFGIGLQLLDLHHALCPDLHAGVVRRVAP